MPLGPQMTSWTASRRVSARDASVVALCLAVAAALLSGCGSLLNGHSVGTDSGNGGSLLAGEGDETAGLSGKLTLTGSSTVAPLAAEIARRFEAQHPEARIDVQTGGSSRGIADALSGVADLGMASRALTVDEEGQGLVGHEVAVDGVSIVVNADNPLAGLTKQQVVEIFRGELSNWSGLGGSDSEIVVVNKAEGRATLEVFLKYFELKNEQIQADVVVGDNQHGIKTVAGNPLAIGYVSIGTAQAEADVGTPIRLVPVDGVEPTAQNVSSGEFGATRPLLIVSNGEPAGLAAAFLEFSRSVAVHDLIEAQGFETVTD